MTAGNELSQRASQIAVQLIQVVVAWPGGLAVVELDENPVALFGFGQVQREEVGVLRSDCRDFVREGESFGLQLRFVGTVGHRPVVAAGEPLLMVVVESPFVGVPQLIRPHFKCSGGTNLR